eukprot:6490274-Amphidinium_carterae.1
MDQGGQSLEYSKKDVPPGWRPGLRHYTFQRYIERVRLWRRTTDMKAHQQGPALASRLEGRPFDLALGLSIVNEEGRTLVGDEALAYEGLAAQAAGDGQPAVNAIADGATQLLRELERVYAADAQQHMTSAIDQFLDLRRGRLPLLDFLSEFEHLRNEAKRLARFDINEVARSHLLLRHSGIHQSLREHIMLLVENNLDRYDEIYRHLEKVAKQQQPSQRPPTLAEAPTYHAFDDEWGDAWDDWTWYEEAENHEYDEDESHTWYDEETEEWTDESWQQPEWQEHEQYYGKGKYRHKGKSKGKSGWRNWPKGKSTSKGSSYWADPPHDDSSTYKGYKGKGKGKSKPKGSSGKPGANTGCST